MQRRQLIRLVGGGVVLSATAGSYRYASRKVFPTPEIALAPWREAGRDSDPRLYALSFAILAPNPHNMQPWIADLSTPSEIAISLDESRLLPATDPFGRQILMGLGGFLELLEMAAASIGIAVDVALFPDGTPGDYLDGRRMALVRLGERGEPRLSPLFDAVLDRRTDRRAYDPHRIIMPKDVEALAAAVSTQEVAFGVEQGERLTAIKHTVMSAWYKELMTERTFMESMKVLRVGSSEIGQSRDGIVITDPLVVALDRLGMFNRFAAPTPDSFAVTSQVQWFDDITASTPAYLWIVTDGNTRHQQIEAGRAYVRVNLAGTTLGLSMHPNQQSLQEYVEVAQEYQTIHTLLGAPQPRFTVQMLARLGAPPESAEHLSPAPRRGLSELIT